MKHIAVIGEGAWGTAVAMLLASNNYEVKLWCHDQEVAWAIEKTRINNRYLPGFKLSPNIIPTHDLKIALSDASIVCEAIPVMYLRSVLEQAKKYVKHQSWVMLS